VPRCSAPESCPGRLSSCFVLDDRKRKASVLPLPASLLKPADKDVARGKAMPTTRGQGSAPGESPNSVNQPAV
jgi:hypothetical protein